MAQSLSESPSARKGIKTVCRTTAIAVVLQAPNPPSARKGIQTLPVRRFWNAKDNPVPEPPCG
jgi:hypothetical protein